jgi:hypothetical protein
LEKAAPAPAHFYLQIFQPGMICDSAGTLIFSRGELVIAREQLIIGPRQSIFSQQNPEGPQPSWSH